MATVQKLKKCAACHGFGKCGDGSKCQICNGTGLVPADAPEPNNSCR